ncbi:ectonucleoside triphosphate diphosphohydrolase 2 isoform X2 [Brachyhypopomus gauderio]|uniref:ectonucleoside triphosphate diphosphohydrolase 2 isoform X2 n=1 Tax=Brachyhypopomus gauderio TaxID=698409 RepID=UPI004042762C
MDPSRAQILAASSLLLFGTIAVILLTIPTVEIQETPAYMYGIVLDAGSSHTAMYTYRWPADKENGTGVVTQHSECHVKGGGISSYAGQQGAAGRSLEACLNQAMRDIPQSRHQLTPVYLGATAGMRLLNMTSPERSSQVLEEVTQTIRSFPFGFQGAAILSGKEEGAYGWVTVNYLLENFIKYGFIGQWLNPGRQTVGALDLGGASTQITFATQEEVEDEDDHMTLRLYGQDYSLYTHSYLCYGKAEVLRRLLAHLLTTQGSTGMVYHPCYPSDYNETVTLDQVFDSPCTQALQPTAYHPQASVSLQGQGHYQYCLGNVSQIFSFQECPFSQCSFDRVFQPNISGNFMAFSAFFFTHSFLEKNTGNSISTPDQLLQAALTVCSMTIEEMSKSFLDQRSFLKDYCASDRGCLCRLGAGIHAGCKHTVAWGECGAEEGLAPWSLALSSASPRAPHRQRAYLHGSQRLPPEKL